MTFTVGIDRETVHGESDLRDFENVVKIQHPPMVGHAVLHFEDESTERVPLGHLAYVVDDSELEES